MAGKSNYKHTLYSCFAAYITSAVINNFVPLLFFTFQTVYKITTAQLGFLVSLNFIIQMFVDWLGSKIADKFNYRKIIITALCASALGLISLAVLPAVMANKLLSLTVAVVFYAMGSGMIEVIVSPMTEALPTKNKDTVMSLMHSFYCWGQMLTVLSSTLFFSVFGIQKWHYLAALWAIVPVCTAISFIGAPIYTLDSSKSDELKMSKLIKSKAFLLFALLMVCSGASELGMSQWASYFAETGLKVSKTVGDLLGPCMFALFMGLSRVFYAKFGANLNLIKFLKYSAVLCVIGYGTATLIPNPVMGLLGCAMCGMSVGLMWPGILSLSSSVMPGAGASLFAILAMFGDIGCFLGPETVSVGASFLTLNSSPIKAGLLCAVVFPSVMLVCIKFLERNINKIYEKN